MPDGLDYNPDGSVVMDAPEEACVYYGSGSVLGEAQALPATDVLVDRIISYIQFMTLNGFEVIGVLRVTNDMVNTISRLQLMLSEHFNSEFFDFSCNLTNMIQNAQNGIQGEFTIEYQEDDYDENDPNGHYHIHIKASRTWLF